MPKKIPGNYCQAGYGAKKKEDEEELAQNSSLTGGPQKVVLYSNYARYVIVRLLKILAYQNLITTCDFLSLQQMNDFGNCIPWSPHATIYGSAPKRRRCKDPSNKVVT